MLVTTQQLITVLQWHSSFRGGPETPLVLVPRRRSAGRAVVSPDQLPFNVPRLCNMVQAPDLRRGVQVNSLRSRSESKARYPFPLPRRPQKLPSQISGRALRKVHSEPIDRAGRFSYWTTAGLHWDCTGALSLLRPETWRTARPHDGVTLRYSKFRLLDMAMAS